MKRIKSKICVIILSFVFSFLLSGQSEDGQKKVYSAKQLSLKISSENLKLIPENPDDEKNGGFHLYVKKLPGINSILLTETTKDPLGKNDSYAYRAKEYNSINGDEIRFLNGQKLVSEGAKYSLVDSTTEQTDFFGEAFHIYIPKVLVYGYSWTRNGEIEIGEGTFINIRTFELPYANYEGDYLDNPFMFNLVKKTRPVKKVEQKTVSKPEPAPEQIPEPVQEPVQEPEPEPEPEPVLVGNYSPVANDKFMEMSGNVIYSKGPQTIIQDICGLLEDVEDYNNLDVVLAVDATGSMKNDIDKLKTDLMNALIKMFGENSTCRVGLLFYRDYGDTFKYKNLPVKVFPFTSNFESVAKNLNSIRINGKEGGDIPEAVYEAMYASCEFYSWRPFAEKQIILIGDAEPHPFPRVTGKYSKDYVMGLIDSKGIEVHTILLPQD